jgi:hypothetical protein
VATAATTAAAVTAIAPLNECFTLSS